MHSTAHAIPYRHCRPLPLLTFRERTGDEGDPARATDWKRVHEQLVSLGKARAAHERDVCRWLLAAQRLGVSARVGYANLAELAARVLGLNERRTEERLRVGRALGELRLLDGALAAGELPWSAVRELTRVATPENEEAWLAWAKGRRVRQIEAAVAARQSGDGPTDRADPSRIKHRLAFAVRAETLALFRDLQSKVGADLGADLDDDTLLYEIARRALGGPGDEGRASYQVAVSRCDECGRGRIDAGGTSLPVEEPLLAMAACDAQTLPPENPHVGARATQTIPPATRRAVLRRDRRRCVVPGCSNHRFLDVHHLDPRAEGGTHDPERLAVLCGAHHRAAHAGSLCIDGTGTGGFIVRHGDGSAYGGQVGVARLDVARRTVGVLERMGFKATQARALVDGALRAGAPEDAEVLLRAALRAS